MRRSATVDGVLLVDKPAGVTSHDVVAAARRATAVQRIGHAGTLDPFATGLLVLLIGHATRLAPYVDGEPKVYETVVTFGAETTTDDRTGSLGRTADPPDPESIDAAIAQLTGVIEQTPPAYSAKKRDGVRSYAAARRGRQVELEPVAVTVHRWTVLDRTPTSLTARIECSGGTYVRALGRDLGRLAGSAAHLSELRRVQSGCFDVANAIPMQRMVEGGTLDVLEPLSAIRSMAVRRVNGDDLERTLHGNPIPALATVGDLSGLPDTVGDESRRRAPSEGEQVAIVDHESRLVAIAECRGELLRPRVVLRDV